MQLNTISLSSVLFYKIIQAFGKILPTTMVIFNSLNCDNQVINYIFYSWFLLSCNACSNEIILRMQTMPALMNAINLAQPVKPKTPIIMRTIANNAYTIVRIILSPNLLTFIHYFKNVWINEYHFIVLPNYFIVHNCRQS